MLLSHNYPFAFYCCSLLCYSVKIDLASLPGIGLAKCLLQHLFLSWLYLSFLNLDLYFLKNLFENHASLQHLSGLWLYPSIFLVRNKNWNTENSTIVTQSIQHFIAKKSKITFRRFCAKIVNYFWIFHPKKYQLSNNANNWIFVQKIWILTQIVFYKKLKKKTEKKKLKNPQKNMFPIFRYICWL